MNLPIMRKIAPLLFFIAITTKLCAQEFYKDGSMKISGISTNKKYGYEPHHQTSIKVGKIENQRAYLNALRGPSGEVIQYTRVGSCCAFKSKRAAFGSGFLDKYEVYYEGLKQPVILYLNGYDFESPKAPLGFTFVIEDQIK